MKPNRQEMESLLRIFAEHPATEDDYLRHNLGRFIATKQRLQQGSRSGARILDVGAHWLHQAVLYAMDGHEVWALDVPATMESTSAKSLSRRFPIRLLQNESLEHPAALAQVANDTFDIVLMTEVLEHLAFNPVAMWREIHRVMKPGAVVVVTTPNYYALRSRLRGVMRLLRRMGGGIDVDQIVGLKTFGHHWKEYSRRELLRYFELLSPDFRCRAIDCMEEYHPGLLARRGGRAVKWLERMLPPLRPDLYVEVELIGKERGIVVEPHW
jgi:2-polyprenyl-6-hydroxyphenyl methylase/3-demethylubiquinone-9 3-methyltransferase